MRGVIIAALILASSVSFAKTHKKKHHKHKSHAASHASSVPHATASGLVGRTHSKRRAVSSITAPSSARPEPARLPVAAHAAKLPGAVDMDLALEVNGALITQPHVAVALDGRGMLAQQMEDGSFYTIEVKPTKKTTHTLMMDFAVSRIVHGQSELIAAPKVIVRNGYKARVEEKVATGDRVSLSVNAKM